MARSKVRPASYGRGPNMASPGPHDRIQTARLAMQWCRVQGPLHLASKSAGLTPSVSPTGFCGAVLATGGSNGFVCTPEVRVLHRIGFLLNLCVMQLHVTYRVLHLAPPRLGHHAPIVPRHRGKILQLLTENFQVLVCRRELFRCRRSGRLEIPISRCLPGRRNKVVVLLRQAILLQNLRYLAGVLLQLIHHRRSLVTRHTLQPVAKIGVDVIFGLRLNIRVVDRCEPFHPEPPGSPSGR